MHEYARIIRIFSIVIKKISKEFVRMRTTDSDFLSTKFTKTMTHHLHTLIHKRETTTMHY